MVGDLSIQEIPTVAVFGLFWSTKCQNSGHASSLTHILTFRSTNNRTRRWTGHSLQRLHKREALNISLYFIFVRVLIYHSKFSASPSGIHSERDEKALTRNADYMDVLSFKVLIIPRNHVSTLNGPCIRSLNTSERPLGSLITE